MSTNTSQGSPKHSSTQPSEEEQALEKINDLSCLSKEQLKLLEEGEIVGNYGQQIIMLHFRKFHERRGIGQRITSASHMAITVEDIGVSAAFYSDVLGLPQIERPNFDRFGAWFTVGNIELHLIKGPAYVSSGEDLIVPHLAIETDDVDACIERLQKMDPPIQFQLNVSVCTEDERGTVKQIFIRDPDGYYIEVGQTHVLTKFCLGHKKYDSFKAIADKANLSDSEVPEKKPLKLFAFFKMAALAQRIKKRMLNRKELRKYQQDRATFDPATVKPDAMLLANMIPHIVRFGSIFNGKTEADVIALLKKHNNCAPDVCLDLTEEIEQKDLQTYNPPTYYDNNVDTNPGTLFQMKRINKSGHIYQKGFYKPGDEAFRYKIMLEDQERILRRINNFKEGIKDPEILAHLEKAQLKQEEVLNEFNFLQDKLKDAAELGVELELERQKTECQTPSPTQTRSKRLNKQLQKQTDLEKSNFSKSIN